MLPGCDCPLQGGEQLALLLRGEAGVLEGGRLLLVRQPPEPRHHTRQREGVLRDRQSHAAG